MTLPVVEQIAEVLVERLEQITTANGYEFDVYEVVRPTRTNNDFSPRNLSILVDQASLTRNDDLSYPGNPPAVAWDVIFNIHCFVRESDKTEIAKATGENEFHSAVIKSIVTSNMWYTMDSLAVIADIGNVEKFSSSTGDHAGVMVPLSVTYRVSEDDPTEVRS
jgi:hypothetical protein